MIAGRFSTGEDSPANVAGLGGLCDDKMAKRALVASAMSVMMPTHAESRHHQEDDQHDRSYHLPGSRLVRHLASKLKKTRCPWNVVYSNGLTFGYRIDAAGPERRHAGRENDGDFPAQGRSQAAWASIVRLRRQVAGSIRRKRDRSCLWPPTFQPGLANPLRLLNLASLRWVLG